MGTAYRYTAYSFTVPGQPVPAPRLTQATSRLYRVATRYYAYKDAVRAALLDAYPTDDTLTMAMAQSGVPFLFAEDRRHGTALVSYALFFQTAKTGRCTHGDPDNIVKAIFDALFIDDRHVLPSCTGVTCGVDTPRVEITLTLLPQGAVHAGHSRPHLVPHPGNGSASRTHRSLVARAGARRYHQNQVPMGRHSGQSR